MPQHGALETSSRAQDARGRVRSGKSWGLEVL